MQATTDNGKASEAHGEQAAQMAGTPPTMPMKRKADEQVGAEDGIDAGEQASPAVQPAAKKGKGKAVAEADGSNATTEETATSLKAPAVKGKKKKAATRKGKKKVSAQASGSSTPREASVQENGGGDVSGEEDLEKLYCLCRTPFVDDELMMIACDHCDEWFHISCVHMTEEQAQLVDVYICASCEPNTLQRTTWRPKCVRGGCPSAALPPLSRYCSQECGVWTAAMRLSKARSLFKGLTSQKMADKLMGAEIQAAQRREGMVIWTEGEDKQAWLESVLGYSMCREEGAKELTADTEALARVERRQSELKVTKDRINAGLDALASRTKLLQLAEDRVAQLEPLREEHGEGESSKADRSASKKKSKKAKEEQQQPPSGQPRCGYDERLSWNDARFHAWLCSPHARDMLEERVPLDGVVSSSGDEEQAEGVGVCGQAKRKCKRHGDWSVLRGADMEVERELQTNLLSSLADQEQDLARRLEQLRAIIRRNAMQDEMKRRHDDAQLAQHFANEGTRRAA